MGTPGFNTWTIIFLFSAIQGLFISVVLLSKRDKHPSRKILASLTILFSVILIDYVLFWTGYQFYYPYLVSTPVCFIFLFGPLFFLYFKSIFQRRGFNRSDLLHFIPFILVFAFFSPFIFKTVSEKQSILSGKAISGSHYAVVFFIWTGIVHMCLYCFLSFRYFYPLSNANAEVKVWFRMLSGFFIGFILSYLSYFILIKFSFFNTAWDYGISFSMMFFIFLVGWYGYMQPKVFSGFTVFEQAKVKYKNSPVTGDPGKEIIVNLEKSMAEKKYFLYNDLNLDKLSGLMNINKHYLSQAINENLKMNFFEYINFLRINEAKKLLATEKKLSIKEIAFQIGYNNKVSFNKAFKNITGVTPGKYREAS
jgi:AraC-like DNA-binding protein